MFGTPVHAFFLTAFYFSFRYWYSDKFVTATCSSAILCFGFLYTCCIFFL